MELELFKIMIQSACSDGNLSPAKKKRLEEKARELSIPPQDLDFLIENELGKARRSDLYFSSGFELTGLEHSDGSGRGPGLSGFLSDGLGGAATPQDGLFQSVSLLSEQGAMSLLQKAKLYGKWVAIKRLKPELRAHPDYLDLFEKEFQNAFELDHPNIVRVMGRGLDPLGPYYYMEYVDGQSLAAMIGPDGLPNGRLIKKIATELLDALEYVHKRQVFHRDLKPENVLVTHKGDNVKLIDFGLAAADQFEDHLRKAGTPRYAPPEQNDLAFAADARSDIFAFGKILLELLTGQTDNLFLVDKRSPALHKIIKKAIEPIPAHRYSSASQMRFDLSALSIPDLVFRPTLSPARLDFGKVPLASERTASVAISNAGAGLLRWQVKSCPEGILAMPSGQRLELVLQTDKELRISDTIVFSSNAGDFELPVEAQVVPLPKLGLSTHDIDFGTLESGQTAQADLLVHNGGSGHLAWQLDHLPPEWLAVEPLPEGLRLSFRPDHVMVYHTVLFLNSNGGNAQVRVKGTLASSDKPILQVEPDQIHCDDLVLGHTKTIFLTINNIGAQDLKWSVKSAPKWVMMRRCEDGLWIEFRPRRAKLHMGNLELASNGGNLSIPLSAEVLPADKPHRLTAQGIKLASVSLLLAGGVVGALLFMDKAAGESPRPAAPTEVPAPALPPVAQPPLASKALPARADRALRPFAGSPRERQLWDDFRLQPGWARLEAYLRAFPDGQHAGLALAEAQTEAMRWQKALAQDEASGYDQFLKDFPQSASAELAALLLSLESAEISFYLDDPLVARIEEEIRLSFRGKQVFGKLRGSSYSEPVGWLGDLSGERSGQELLLRRADYDGTVQQLRFRLEPGKLVRVFDGGQELAYPIK